MVDELDKAIRVAAKDPARHSLDETEFEKCRKWTSTSRDQADTIRNALQAETKGKSLTPNINGVHKKLMRLSNDYASKAGGSIPVSHDNHEFISSQSDRQLLLIKQQDEELDELSATVQRIGGVGLTIHDELVGQERILDDLSLEMETTSNRLDFVQSNYFHGEKSCCGDEEQKNAGANGQIMMIGS